MRLWTVNSPEKLEDLMRRKKVDVLGFQETRWKDSQARCLGEGLRLVCQGADEKMNDVGLLLKEEHLVCPLA